MSKFYEDVFYEYNGESREEYVKRVDKIFGKYYTNVDCRSNNNRASYLKTYYKNKYAKSSNENDQEYFERVLVKKSESASQYQSRVELMKKFVQSVDWSKVTIDTNSNKGFSIQNKSSTQTRDLCYDKKVCGLVLLHSRIKWLFSTLVVLSYVPHKKCKVKYYM